MNKKIFLCIAVFILIDILPSCTDQKYEIDYPEIYTPEYCSENYVDADPSLEHLYAAQNSIGTIDQPISHDTYFAIKDVPLDEYLSVRHTGAFQYTSGHIVKNKNKDLPTYEILSYEIEKVELIWRSFDDFNEDDVTYEYFHEIGTKGIKKSAVLSESENAMSFQSHIAECLDTNNYKSNEIDAYIKFLQPNGFTLRIRVYFSKYKNIVWDSHVSEFEGKYYITFYQNIVNENNPDGMWNYVYIPLNEELEEKLKIQLHAE